MTITTKHGVRARQPHAHNKTDFMIIITVRARPGSRQSEFKVDAKCSCCSQIDPHTVLGSTAEHACITHLNRITTKLLTLFLLPPLSDFLSFLFFLFLLVLTPIDLGLLQTALLEHATKEDPGHRTCGATRHDDWCAETRVRKRFRPGSINPIVELRPRSALAKPAELSRSKPTTLLPKHLKASSRIMMVRPQRD